MATQLQGTFEEAKRFLTNEVTGWTAWTDLHAINHAIHILHGKRSLAEMEEGQEKVAIYGMLDMLDYYRMIPPEYEAQWEDWLNAYMGGDPEIEILLFEEAVLRQK